MKRILLAITLFLTLIGAANAQSTTTVTSTVKDPNGVAYAFGTYGITFTNPTTQQAFYGGVPLQPSQMLYTGQLDINGALSISLPSNAVITPSGTQWTFKICANASQIAMVYPPPTLPCFSSAQTISGSSQVITFTAATIPTTGGGITSVASLPGGSTIYLAKSCPVGATNCFASPINTKICSGIPVTITNTSTSVSCASALVTKTGGASVTGNVATVNLVGNPLTFAATPWVIGDSITISGFIGGDTFYNGTFVLTGVTSSAVTFALVHANASSTSTGLVRDTNVGYFTAADIGDIIWGTNACCNNGPSAINSLILPQSTILSVTNSTTVGVAIAATGSVSASATGYLVWGGDDSAGLIAANAAWVNNPTCSSFLLPAAYMITTVPQFNSPPRACDQMDQPGGTQIPAGAILGWGNNESVIFIAPNLNFTNCTTGCFLGFNGVTARDWGMSGGWNNNPSGGHSSVLVNPGSGSRLMNMEFVGFGAGDGTTIGIQEGAFSHFSNVYLEGFGQTTCNIQASGDTQNWSGGSCGNSNGNSLVITGNGQWNSSSMWFGQSLTTAINIGSASTWNSNGDYVYASSGLSNFFLNGSGVIHFNNLRMSGGATNGLSLFGVKVYAQNSFFSGTNAVFISSGTFFDLGGNTYTGVITTIAPTCAFTTGGGTSPSCALQAGSTNEKGTIIATTGTGAPGSTGTITLTFAGTFTGAAGTTPSCSLSPNDSGTAWGNGALAKVSTQSTTAPVFAWSNSAANVLTALAVSSPFRIDYTCTPR